MVKSIQKVLVANRGEIACRVMRTCQKLGIATVAVYSDADKAALHVEVADEAYAIGAAPARESYLDMAKILDVAKKSGADAVHPGYGFLSENEEFAEACEKAGVAFIGPPASAILAMGGKSEAKALMEKAGVPLVPGYHGDNQDEKFLQKEAEKIGFPVLIKASAGGGGKGMRVVDNAAAFAEQLAGAKREAKGSFGDEKVLIEKYLVNPRHVEIQVFADQHGNCVYLFERDCSIQRRHQKVLEEAPAPHMPEAVRAKMGAAAVAAAQAIGYVGAGTVEFLLDTTGEFYFMEMNTRLQVEHPVTEKITGLDLVELQIRVAEGEKLPFTQDDLKINGHSIEVRLYAEDPANDFLPGAGKISFLRFPMESDGLRVDTGVREAPYGDGDVISIYYDPMIAKIISWGETRDVAIRNMSQALDETQIAGPKSNINFLRALLRHPAFGEGKVSTRFIGDHREVLLPEGVQPSKLTLALATIGLLKRREEHHEERRERSSDPQSPWHCLAEWRIGGTEVSRFSFRYGEKTHDVSAVFKGDHTRPELVFSDGVTMQVYYEASGYDMGFDAEIDGKTHSAVVVAQGRHLTVLHDGVSEDMLFLDPLHAEAGDDEGGGKLTAPMPGKVVAIPAKAGSKVKKGDPLVIVEAMKMEHTISAPCDGEIESVNAAVGEQVDEKRELVGFKKAG